MKEVDPQSTSRALAFELWMKAPMPMVTLMKTLDVTALVRLSRKRGYKFNMLLCWCIGKAAASMEDFYLLPVGEKLIQYDRLAINTVVATRDGSIATCDIPVSADLEQFNQDYLKLTGQVREIGESYELGEDYMVIGTSALAGYEIDGAVNIYAGCYNNPFLIWGKYRKKWLRATLPVSFQFHHTQLDGIPAAEFLERLEQLIRSVKDTIGAEERNEIMNDEQKFEAFKQRAVAHNEEVYGAEIRAKYGEQEVDEANAAVMNLTREQYQEWTDLGREIRERLEAAVQAGVSPESEEGKEITALHRRWLTITGNRYDPAKHRGIAELYVMDQRFTGYYDKQVPGCARFLRDAVIHWVK